MNNNECKIFLVDNDGNSHELKGGEIPTITGVDLANGPDRTGCCYVNPKLSIRGMLLFDNKTADSFKLAFAERWLKAWQSWRYYKVRHGRVRRRIKSLKRKIKVIKRRYSGDAEWLTNMDFIRKLI